MLSLARSRDTANLVLVLPSPGPCLPAALRYDSTRARIARGFRTRTVARGGYKFTRSPPPQPEPREPLGRRDGHAVRRVPPGREPSFLNPHEAEAVSFPKCILDGLAAHACESRDVLQSERASPLPRHLDSDDGQDRLL